VGTSRDFRQKLPLALAVLVGIVLVAQTLVIFFLLLDRGRLAEDQAQDIARGKAEAVCVKSFASTPDVSKCGSLRATVSSWQGSAANRDAFSYWTFEFSTDDDRTVATIYLDYRGRQITTKELMELSK
jgi:hypothetical protein